MTGMDCSLVIVKKNNSENLDAERLHTLTRATVTNRARNIQLRQTIDYDVKSYNQKSTAHKQYY